MCRLGKKNNHVVDLLYILPHPIREQLDRVVLKHSGLGERPIWNPCMLAMAS